MRVALAMALAVTACTQREWLLVEGARPEAAAANLVEKKFGIDITYEDPEIVYAADLRDMAEVLPRPTPPGQYFIPRGGPLRFPYESNMGGQPVDVDTLVSALASAASSDAVQFKVSKSDSRSHLIPTWIRDRSGNPIPYEPLLDTRVSFPPGRRNGWEFLRSFCAAVTSARRVRLGLGTFPTNTLMQMGASRGANDEVAREVLQSALSSSRLSWRLSCDSEGCMLNLHYVPMGPTKI
jgi:hypothetical protein